MIFIVKTEEEKELIEKLMTILSRISDAHREQKLLVIQSFIVEINKVYNK